MIALYDGEIRYTDSYVARLLEAFDGAGLSKDTLVIVFGDHGDEFYEHGTSGHGRTLYNEMMHVPLILRWPDQLPRGKRVDALTSLVDIMPTALDYLGVSYKGPLQGASLRPVIDATTGRLHDNVWAELKTTIHVQAVVNEDYRFVRDLDHDAWELYDLRRDSGDRTNLYNESSMAEMCAKMMAQWRQWAERNDVLAKELTHGAEPPKSQLTEQQLRQLKALGYAQ